jgi:hypothetical protein
VPPPADTTSFTLQTAPPPEPTPSTLSKASLASPIEPAPIRHAENPSAGTPDQSLQELEQVWSRLVDAVGKASAFVKTYLLEAHPVSMTKSVLTIGYDPEFSDHLSLVDNARNHTLLQTKLQEMGFNRLQVKFIKAEAPAGRVRPSAMEPETSTSEEPRTLVPPPASASASPAPAAATAPKPTPAPAKMDLSEFKNDPLIQKALEIFKGTIVEIRA